MEPGEKRQWLRLMVIVGALAFVLNLLWEYAQCSRFFVHEALPPTNAAMIVATAGDVLLTAIAYAVVAAYARDATWPLRRWGIGVWLAVEIAAVTEAVAMEGMALATHRWSYTTAAPRLPGTHLGLLPVLQLMALFPLSFAMGAWITRLITESEARVRRRSPR